MTTPNQNVFEKETGGRFIDLGSRLSAAEIERMSSINTKRCPDCHGGGCLGMAIAVDRDTGAVGILPIVCDLCGGSGEAMYMSVN